MSVQKQFFAKVYDADGTTPLKNLAFEAPADGSMFVKSPPMFTARTNGGLSELVLDVKTAWDSFSEGTTVNFMNIVDLYAVRIDGTTQTSTRIYRGYVSQYEPYLDGGDEGVRVTLLGLASLLTKSYYGNPTDFTVIQSAVDPKAIAQDIADKFNAVFGGSLISYDSSSMPASVGTNVTKTFTDRRWFDALNDTKDLAGTGWFWKVDHDGKLHFRAKPGTPTHRFTVGKDIDSITATKSGETVKNDIIVRRSGGTTTTYSDATSQSTFGTGGTPSGRFTEIVTDSAITDATTADQRGNKELNDNKDAKVKATVVINDSYNIESVHAGDTCSINNFNNASTFFGSNNLLVASVRYEPDRVSLELEEQTTSFALQLDAFVNP